MKFRSILRDWRVALLYFFPYNVYLTVYLIFLYACIYLSIYIIVSVFGDSRALESNGLKIMVLLRLSPLIPYNALDYISGVTSISLKDYTIALVAILPGALMLCFLGASASSLSDRTSSTSSNTIKIITIVSGILFGGCGVYMASYYSKLELDRVSLLLFTIYCIALESVYMCVGRSLCGSYCTNTGFKIIYDTCCCVQYYDDIYVTFPTKCILNFMSYLATSFRYAFALGK